MGKLNQITESVCRMTGLRADPLSGAMYGYYNGYTVDVSIDGRSSQYCIRTAVRTADGAGPDQNLLKARVKECKEVLNCQVSGRQAVFPVRSSVKAEAYAENIRTALGFVTAILQQSGYIGCCQRCGQTLPTEVCSVGGSKAILCQSCFQAVKNESFQRQQIQAAKKENVVGGVVGALLGSLIGAAAIILISRLGFVAAVSGLIMGVCTLKGYEMLGGKLTKKGVVISVIIMLLMVYVADRFDWAIMASSELGDSVFSWFRAIPEMVSDGYIESGVYYGNLAKLYLFAILGAVPTIINTVRAKQVENKVDRMN